MSRLTRRNKYGIAEPYIDLRYQCEYDDWVSEVADKLAEYEELEEQGRLIKLPCKVGDTVYMVQEYEYIAMEVEKGVVFAIGTDKANTMWISVRYENGLRYYHPSKDIGENLFLTREEAEAKLKEGEG